MENCDIWSYESTTDLKLKFIGDHWKGIAHLVAMSSTIGRVSRVAGFKSRVRVSGRGFNKKWEK